jgi:hypothetical protein
MICTYYRLGSRRERFRGVPLLLHSVAVGYLAELRGPDGSDEHG